MESEDFASATPIDGLGIVTQLLKPGGSYVKDVLEPINH